MKVYQRHGTDECQIQVFLTKIINQPTLTFCPSMPACPFTMPTMRALVVAMGLFHFWRCRRKTSAHACPKKNPSTFDDSKLVSWSRKCSSKLISDATQCPRQLRQNVDTTTGKDTLNPCSSIPNSVYFPSNSHNANNSETSSVCTRPVVFRWTLRQTGRVCTSGGGVHFTKSPKTFARWMRRERSNKLGCIRRGHGESCTLARSSCHAVLSQLHCQPKIHKNFVCFGTKGQKWQSFSASMLTIMIYVIYTFVHELFHVYDAHVPPQKFWQLFSRSSDTPSHKHLCQNLQKRFANDSWRRKTGTDPWFGRGAGRPARPQTSARKKGLVLLYLASQRGQKWWVKEMLNWTLRPGCALVTLETLVYTLLLQDGKQQTSQHAQTSINSRRYRMQANTISCEVVFLSETNSSSEQMWFQGPAVSFLCLCDQFNVHWHSQNSYMHKESICCDQLINTLVHIFHAAPDSPESRRKQLDLNTGKHMTAGACPWEYGSIHPCLVLQTLILSCRNDPHSHFVTTRHFLRAVFAICRHETLRSSASWWYSSLSNCATKMSIRFSSIRINHASLHFAVTIALCCFWTFSRKTVPCESNVEKKRT